MDSRRRDSGSKYRGLEDEGRRGNARSMEEFEAEAEFEKLGKSGIWRKGEKQGRWRESRSDAFVGEGRRGWRQVARHE